MATFKHRYQILWLTCDQIVNCPLSSGTQVVLHVDADHFSQFIYRWSEICDQLSQISYMYMGLTHCLCIYGLNVGQPIK